MSGPVNYAYTGQRYLLGRDDHVYGIWDRRSPAAPLESFPLTPEGWGQAWSRYSALEPGAAPVGPPAYSIPPPSSFAGPTAYGQKSTTPGWLIGLIVAFVGLFVVGILVAIAIPTFLGARARAQDRAAQSQLLNGMAAAKTFFTDKDQYTGFSSDQAKAIEPSLAWNDSPVAATNTVSIRGVSSKTVVLVTRSESGTTFCLADNVSGGISGSSYGRIDAQTAAECQGGWEMNFGSP